MNGKEFEKGRDTVYPISEIFCSPQGEGQYTGHLMVFIRLAGCCVGKPFPGEQHVGIGDKAFKLIGDNERQLPVYTEMCTTYDGRTFECDTDYRVKERLSVESILSRVAGQAHRVCITGGEPMIHNLLPLVSTLLNEGYKVHMETSGTVPMHKAFRGGDENAPHDWPEDAIWVTVSPKHGVLDEMILRANEIKLLVDENFEMDKLPEMLRHSLNKTYIQPINGEHTLNFDNLKRCIDIQPHYPEVAISTQMHKIWRVR